MGTMQHGKTNDFVIDELALKINERTLKSWENYAFEMGNDISRLDNDVFQLMTQLCFESIPSGRKKEVLYRKYLIESVESDSLICELKRRLEIKIHQIKSSDLPSCEKKELYPAINEKILQLMRVRQKKAKDIGFQSYPQLAFHYQECDLIESEKLIRSFLKSHLNRVKEMLHYYDFSWDGWIESLNRVGKDFSWDMTVNDILNFIVKHPEFSAFRNEIRVDIVENGPLGMSFPVDSKDIRIILSENRSIYELSSLFHEMGHALIYFSIPEEPVYSWLTPFFDEVGAAVIERLLSKQMLPDHLSSIIAQVRLIESIRCSIRFLFEMDLWETMENAESLFEYYQNWLGIKPMPSSCWGVETFQIANPLNIHALVLGEIYAGAVERKIEQHPTIMTHDVLPYIIQHLATGGMRVPFMDRYQRLLKSLSS